MARFFKIITSVIIIAVIAYVTLIFWQLNALDKIIEKHGKESFHIYAVDHVKGAVKILTSVPWGQNDDENTVYGSICARLDELSLNRDHRPWWHFWN